MIAKRYIYKIFGQVQGVGFRPFIYKLANKLTLTGFVKNTTQGVILEVEGNVKNLDIFYDKLNNELPLLARIDKIEKNEIKLQYQKIFKIKKSSLNNNKIASIPPDTAICKECLLDISLEKSRFKNYFATNCTNCGPRYSIIKTIPYDRVNTSMKKFSMCQSCLNDYKNPLNRRYHAQPMSCNSCGPLLYLSIKDEVLSLKDYDIFKKVAYFIENGKIGAIKGIGGFHIVCDATNDKSISLLREYKNRLTKPFAVMCKDIKQIKSFAKVDKKEKKLLEDNKAPIVILKKLDTSHLILSPLIAPLIDRIGCILPYTALHHLLFLNLNNPIVATSANKADEPIIINKNDILEKLPFIDFIVDFNRDIVNAIDDSVVQVIDNNIQLLRGAKGFSPTIIKLPIKYDKKILAVGANQKNTIAILIEDTIIVSPHIGDLDSLKAFEYFNKTLETFKKFYDFEPDLIVCDKHPNYETTKWAEKQNKPILKIQHHLAHIYSCKAEFGLTKNYLGFSFDGTGYGDDKTLWGGEIFVGDKRKYHFKPIKLLGANMAIKEPRRVALSMLFDNYTLDDILTFDLKLLKSFNKKEIEILYQSYTKNLNTPLSSSVGRLFDAIASFSNICQFQSFEGEAGLKCEQYFNSTITTIFKYKIIDGIIDIKFDFFSKDLITIFINTLVQIVVDISQKENLDVILSGGVFQNKTLLELITAKLKTKNIKYFYQQTTAINDGGIALGQLYYYIQKI